MADSKPKVTLHWLDVSRAQRVVWLLELCNGIDIDIKLYKRGEDKLAPKELKSIHPLGKAPIITIEAPNLKEPLTLVESGVIFEYLCDHFAPHLIPKRYQDGKEGQLGGETEEWMRYRFFMHYAEGSLMPPMVLTVVMDGIRNAPVPFFLKPITRSIADMYVKRHEYFRWTRRTGLITFAYVVAIPAVFVYYGWTTDGKWQLRGKRRGDVISEF